MTRRAWQVAGQGIVATGQPDSRPQPAPPRPRSRRRAAPCLRGAGDGRVRCRQAFVLPEARLTAPGQAWQRIEPTVSRGSPFLASRYGWPFSGPAPRARSRTPPPDPFPRSVPPIAAATDGLKLALAPADNTVHPARRACHVQPPGRSAGAGVRRAPLQQRTRSIMKKALLSRHRQPGACWPKPAATYQFRRPGRPRGPHRRSAARPTVRCSA
ncbi:hypothetical protein ACU4GD_31300 [Cupriavidus basilensis]